MPVDQPLTPEQRRQLQNSLVGIEGVKTFLAPSVRSDVPQIDKTQLDHIIGLPPVAHREFMGKDADVTNKVLGSMPVCRITPGLPKSITKGIRIYDFDANGGRERWQNIIRICEGNLRSDIEPPLLVAFLNEGPVTESWQNEYSESMFEQIGNKALPAARELRYITGQERLSGALGEVSKRFDTGGIQKGLEKIKNNDDIGSGFKDALSGVLNLGSTLAGGALKGGGELLGDLENLAAGSPLGRTIMQLAYGSNIDFPMIWNASSYLPQYSITVRLVNPFPVSTNAYERYIIEPLIRLLAFTIPITDSASTYTYPIICKVECPGLFEIRAGYVQSIDVVKGLEGNDIGYMQRANTVDIKITFGDLYSTMVQFTDQADEGANQDRPTLKRYIDNMRGLARFPYPYESVVGNVTSNSVSYTSETTSFRPEETTGTGSVAQPQESSRVNQNKKNSTNTLRNNTGYINQQRSQLSVNDESEVNYFRSYINQVYGDGPNLEI